MERLQKARDIFGPMRISSGYRCAKHPLEAKKARPGAHASGHAADVAVRGEEAHRLLKIALEVGFTGIGVQQKGEGRFIHLDDLDNDLRPTVWSIRKPAVVPYRHKVFTSPLDASRSLAAVLRCGDLRCTITIYS
jgi:zinc D-Ala-D-Ala carboxypeptidase